MTLAELHLNYARERQGLILFLDQMLKQLRSFKTSRKNLIRKTNPPILHVAVTNDRSCKSAVLTP